MWWLFKQKKDSEQDLKKLEKKIKNSFTSVKEDTTNLFAWVNYMKELIDTQQGLIHELQTQLSAVASSIDLKTNHLHKKVGLLADMSDQTFNELKKHSSRLTSLEGSTKSRASGGSNALDSALSLIKKHKALSANKLKHILVEQRSLCSRSTFYRLLKQLEEEPALVVVRNGRNLVFSVPENISKQKF